MPQQRKWSVQEAKYRFSEVVAAARRLPQTVTKHGKPAVVVMDVAEYERLRRLEQAQAPSFAELLLEMPQDDGKFPRFKVPPRQRGSNTGFSIVTRNVVMPLSNSRENRRQLS